jgi:hypothetical protein
MTTNLLPRPGGHRHLRNAAQLETKGIFPGSPLELFDAGRLSLMVLLHAGLYPDHRVLEIGCGALRSGYWIIHFLMSHGYYGIEPNERMLHAGIECIFPRRPITKRDLQFEGGKPHFIYNDQFDPAGFGGRLFDFFLCCSIWSHAAKTQIEKMLDQFILHTPQNGRFLTSYIPATNEAEDYQGVTWVGRSHQSDQKDSVRHSLRWITEACEVRGLAVVSLPATYDFSNQTWLMIERGGDG